MLSVLSNPFTNKERNGGDSYIYIMDELPARLEHTVRLTQRHRLFTNKEKNG